MVLMPAHRHLERLCGRGRLFFSVSAFSWLSCSPIVREPPFPIRPDTVQPGNLLGPYDGQVVDSETGQPLPHASVVASWRFTRGVGLRGPAGGHNFETQTNADGRYQIPLLTDLPSGLSTDVSAFTLFVATQGYKAYRSDREVAAHGLRPRRGFAQRNHRIELKRFAPDDSHADHLKYFGMWGGPATLTQAAVLEIAAAESERQRPTPVPAQSLDATRWLTLDDVETITGYSGQFEVRKLREPPTTETSDTHHLRAVNQPERFDVALRAWHIPARAEEQYDKLLRTYPGAIARDEMLDRSFRATEGELLALGLLDRSRGLVLALTCGVGLCPNHEVVLKLAARMLEHVAQDDSDEKTP